LIFISLKFRKQHTAQSGSRQCLPWEQGGPAGPCQAGACSAGKGRSTLVATPVISEIVESPTHHRCKRTIVSAALQVWSTDKAGEICVNLPEINSIICPPRCEALLRSSAVLPTPPHGWAASAEGRPWCAHVCHRDKNIYTDPRLPFLQTPWCPFMSEKGKFLTSPLMISIF
jgi:hypothetical protein